MNKQIRWSEANNIFLTAAIQWLRQLLRQEDSTNTNGEASIASEIQKSFETMTAAAAISKPPALMTISQQLGLSTFEERLLLLCAAMELDTGIASLCARAQDIPERPYPTFALALTLFEQPRWDVLSPERPLRYWRLLEITRTSSIPLTVSPLVADERVVSYIKGLNYLDSRLRPYLMPADVADPLELPPSQKVYADKALQTLIDSPDDLPVPVIQLAGIDKTSKQLVAHVVASSLGLQLYTLPTHLIPAEVGELDAFARLWERESLLLPIALHLDAHDLDMESPEDSKATLILRFLARSNGVFFLDTHDIWWGLGRQSFDIDVSKPTPKEQLNAWTNALGSADGHLPVQLSSQFHLNTVTIDKIARQAINTSRERDKPLGDQIWNACLAHTRPQLDALAQRITTHISWDDIVLPDQELGLLRHIAAQVKQRSTVYDTWGFRQRTSRGLGISVLFAGESGTGKTMAAELLANDLELNLFRIDLSGVVSKYIGETEKNLRKLFDAAEDGGALLFFDEADALFGKRSEVRDSHDRYANIEVNYLLQRIEAYQGLAILATNLKSSLDDAFIRRLRFVVTFPFPTKKFRLQMWQQVFPEQTPLREIDYERMAGFRLTGGSIFNIALNAAFIAADAGKPVDMRYLLEATRIEFFKRERLIDEEAFALNSENDDPE